MGEMIELFGVITAVAGVPMLVIFGVPPIAKAIARRIERTAPMDAEALAEIEALRAEVDELRAMAPRMLELEERVDFAERLLARPTEPAQHDAGRME